MKSDQGKKNRYKSDSKSIPPSKRSAYDLPKKENSSNNKDDGVMNTVGNVDYELTELDNGCDHPQCESRRRYGVSVKKQKVDYFLGVSIIRHTSYKEFCPKHRSSTKVADEAINKEHEVAKEEWDEIKKNRVDDNFDKIVNSYILPTFYYEGNILRSQVDSNKRFVCSVEGYDNAIEYLKESDISVPVLLYSTNKMSIIHKYNNTEEYNKNKIFNITYQEFKDRFDDINYVSREFYAVRSNRLTGIKCSDTRVNEINDIIDSVIEWREYKEEQGKLKIRYCPACGHSCSRYHTITLSRVQIDGDEKIIPIHDKCDKIMGEMNEKFIDNELYEIYD